MLVGERGTPVRDYNQRVLLSLPQLRGPFPLPRERREGK